MSDFVERVRKSGLVDDHTLQAALSPLGDPPHDPLRVAQHLVRESLLTKWQCQQLLEGRYKGFWLGKYKLLHQLGRGGMSMVFVAEHSGMQRKVALKLLPQSRAHDASFVERFRREARASAALNHPNIVRAYDFDCQGEAYYLVTELIEGKNLRELIAAEHPLPLPRVARLIAAASRGLQHAHDSGFVHRDIKPANILVDAADEAKILDLGLAMWADADPSSVTFDHQEHILGTVDYLAPEQAVNSHAVDRRADIYALGGTLYYALTGQPPYPTGSVGQKIAQHQSAPPPDPRVLRADCPAALSTLCLQMLQKTASARPASAAEVSERLQAFLADDGSGIGLAAKGAETAGPTSGRLRAAEADATWPRNRSRPLVAKPRHSKGTERLAPFVISDFAHPSTATRKKTRTPSTRMRRRRTVPWWLWLSIVGLLVAAAWMWQQIQ